MADKKTQFADEIKRTLAEHVGVPVIGKETLPDVTVSTELREVELFLNTIRVAHDRLADRKDPARRLVPKRGRKAGHSVKELPTDAESVIEFLK